ncbi:MAG: tetratricopeptide repeat protein, partial [Candidatus Omnitrophica bacterium]|nr:tetratricopeptide repeat protein [Candidatus Omnitrophota bacterium]
MKKVGGIGRIIIFAFLCTGAVSPGELCAGKPFQGYAARHAEEQRILEKALDADPRDHVAATRLGEVYWQKGKKKAAIKLFRRAIRAAPEYSPPYFFIGKAYFFEKKPEKGTAQFDIFERKMDVLISSDKSLTDFYVSCLYHMSYLYSTLKRYEDVAGGYKKIIKIKPDEQKAH